MFSAFITFSITFSLRGFVLFHVICGTSILTSTVSFIPFFFFFPSTASSVNGISVKLLLSLSTTYIYGGASIQSFLPAHIPRSSAAVPVSMQSKWLSFKQKIHSFHHCLARKMLFCKSVSVYRSCVKKEALKNVSASLNCNLLIFSVTLVHR